LTRALVVYDSKYGNTKVVAELIAKGIQTKGKIKTNLIFMDDIDVKKMSDYDILVIGSPNHYSKPSKKTLGFIEKLRDMNLASKKIAAFDTCLRKQEGRAFRKIEARTLENVPGSQVVTPGLSILVGGLKGPILDGELPKCEEFGKKIAKG